MKRIRKYPRDLSSLKFGRLLVLKQVEKPEHLKSNKTYWLCECDCGNKTTVIRTALTCGNSTSCGCFRNEKLSELYTTHGLSKSRFKAIWTHMKRRCEVPSNNQYHNYGGRGIKVCEEWQIFENFMNDMYEDYIEFEKINGENTASIDRINSNGNYYKENCKWATQLEQARNRADNISVIVNGVEYATLSELAEAYNINYHTVTQRYNVGKRDLDLVKEPREVKDRKKAHNPRSISVEVNGVIYESLASLQRDYPHISLVSISKRYKKGLRGEDLIAK